MTQIDVDSSVDSPETTGPVQFDYQPPRDTFVMPQWGFETFKEGFDKLARRATKLGVTPPVYTVVATQDIPQVFREPHIKAGRPNGEVVRYFTVRVSGESPKYDGWSLVASLQNFEGKVLIRGVPGKEVPVKYRTADPSNCDHCGMKVYRKDTFVVGHEDGRLTQIGRQCIRDFLGHLDPRKLALWAEITRTIMAMGEDSERADYDGPSGRRAMRFIDLQEYITQVCASIRECGWKPRLPDSRSTSSDALERLFPHKYDSYKGNPPAHTPEDYIRAQEAIQWACTMEPTNDFLHNLHVMAEVGVTDDRGIGIAAALIRAWDRTLEASKKVQYLKPVAERKYVGTIGERLNLKVTLMDEVQAWDGDFGTSYFHRFACDGNAVILKSSNKLNVKVGVETEIRCTVKQHALYTPKARDGGKAMEATPQTTVFRAEVFVPKVKVKKPKAVKADVPKIETASAPAP